MNRTIFALFVFGAAAFSREMPTDYAGVFVGTSKFKLDNDSAKWTYLKRQTQSLAGLSGSELVDQPDAPLVQQASIPLLRLPSPRLIQELVQAWRALRHYRLQ